MALTAEQVYVLNTITYLNKPGVVNIPVGTTLKDFATLLQSNKDLVLACTDGEFLTQTDILTVCNTILSDSNLCDTRLEYSDNGGNGGDRMIFSTPSESGGRDANVVFEGTVGSREWYDDAVAGSLSPDGKVLSEVQQETLNWYRGDEVQNILAQYDSVTVSGHSKGGNKAKLLTLLCDDIDRCISFDGQGFSDEFISEFDDEIARNRGKITNYNNADDYVSILLNDVGATVHIQGYEVDNFMVSHSLFTLCRSLPFDDYTVPQNPLLKEMDMVLNGYLRSLSLEDRQQFLELIGCILRDTLGKDGTWDDIPDYIKRLFMARDGELLMGLIGYIGKYGSAELYLAALELLKAQFPFLSVWLDPQIAKAEEAVRKLREAGIDRYASTGHICMDTVFLACVVSELRSICANLESCAADISACAAKCNDFPITVNINLAISALLTKGGLGFFSGSPIQVINRLNRAAHQISDSIGELSTSVQKAAQQFDECEEKILGLMY